MFIDRSLGRKKVASALRQAGAQVEVHDDHFPPDANDEHWLTAVGERGWLVLTKDLQIRRRATERQALMRAGVGAFVLTARGLDGAQMAETFVKALPAMRRFVSRNQPPFIARITRDGSVSLLMAPR